MFCLGFDVFNHFGHGFVDAALNVERVGSCGHVLHAFCQDGLSQDSSGCRTVAGVVASLAGYALDELCACILECIVEFYFLCDRNTVLCDARSAEFLVDNDVAAFRAEGYFHCVGQHVSTFFEELAGFYVVFQFFCHGF